MENTTEITTKPSFDAAGGVTAEKIIEAHRDVARCAATMIARGNDFVLKAAACGKLLIAKKAEMGHGEFLPWLAQNIKEFGYDTANDYMKLGAKLERAPNLEGAISLRHALALLSEKSEPGAPREKPVFAIRFALNYAPDSLDPVQRKTLFDESKPLLQVLEDYGFVKICA
jgi:hypothetical protein